MVAKIKNYEDFVKGLIYCGMTMASENSEQVFSLGAYFDTDIAWHTEDADTDPWEWRMKVLQERNDIAYGKLFFKKAGYITSEYFPYFYKVRRKNTLIEEYENGAISQSAKKIYELMLEEKEMPLHLIKEYAGFTAKEDKTKFQSAMTELQMKLYISMCGGKRKESKTGNEYGWNTTVFCLTEHFFQESVLDAAKNVTEEEAFLILKNKIVALNPNVKEARLHKFILGR